MVWAALVGALLAAPFSGPAVLVIHTNAHGEQFAYFSSFERCETFRRQLESDWDRRTREILGITDPARPTPKPSQGTGSTARCVPG